MSVDPRDEARALVSSVRELLVELAEEGVDGLDLPTIEPVALPQTPVAEAIAPEPATSRARPVAARREAVQPPVAANAAISPQPKSSLFSESATLQEVQQVLGDCRRCGLCEGRKNIVFGSGNPDADLMFIGEGPGEQEDIQGLPFVGRAGELLTQMIEKGIDIPRDDVYICNIVKCRPPKNRNPLPDEVSACKPFLDGQIRAVKPKVIVSLGKPAAGLLLGRDVAITRIRGTWHDYNGIPLMPTLHPAFILRQYTAENRRHVWEDLKAAVARVSG